MPCAEHKLTICTYLSNLPAVLVRNIIRYCATEEVEIVLAIKPRMILHSEDEPFRSLARCLSL